LAVLKFLTSKKISGVESDKNRAYLSFFVLLLIAIMAIDLYWYAPIARVDFYDELWGPSHLLLQGKSPYETSSINPMEVAGWFPMAIGFYFPLGLLDAAVATKVWLVLNIIALCMIIYIAQGKDARFYDTVIVAVLCFFFPPLLHHFALGQITLTVVLCLVLSIDFIVKDWQWMTAFSIALAFSKPHLAVFPVLGLCYYYYRYKRQQILPLLAKTFLMLILLCVPLFVAFPNWIPDAIKSMSELPSWEYPSLFVFLPKHLGASGYIVCGFIAILILIVVDFQWKYNSPRNAMYWSIALPSLISPYLGSWDFVMLFPLLVATFSHATWKWKIFIVVSYYFAWRLMALVQMQHGGLNYYFWWVPLWFVCTLSLATNWRKAETARFLQAA
jgi:hypothetical protein